MGHSGLSEVASSLDALLPTDMMLGQFGSKKRQRFSVGGAEGQLVEEI